MKILKPVLLSFFAVFVAVFSAVASYIITGNILNKASEKAINEISGKENTVVVSNTEADAVKAKNNEDLKKYFIKLEGDKINIYVSFEEHEELLFGEQINISDLSEADIKILSEGVEFEKMSELYAFAENFTS